MKKFSKLNESYKPATEFIINQFGWRVPVQNHVDEVFDCVVDIICTVHGISEKNFKGYDETRNYVELYFDNNPQILHEIDTFKGKRSRYCAEFLYDKYFNKNRELIEKLKLLPE